MDGGENCGLLFLADGLADEIEKADAERVAPVPTPSGSAR